VSEIPLNLLHFSQSYRFSFAVLHGSRGQFACVTNLLGFNSDKWSRLCFWLQAFAFQLAINFSGLSLAVLWFIRAHTAQMETRDEMDFHKTKRPSVRIFFVPTACEY
jgi:hypothetical protein